MPTENETRVRVEVLSKITATVCGPASGLVAEPVGLQRVGQVEHLGLLGRTEVVVAQEVPDVMGQRCRDDLDAGRSVDRARRQGRDETVSLSRGQDQRRGEPDRVRVDGVDDEAGVQRRVGDLRRPTGWVSSIASSSPATAHAGDQRMVEREDADAQPVADHPALASRPSRSITSEHGETRGAGDRIAAEGACRASPG